MCERMAQHGQWRPFADALALDELAHQLRLAGPGTPSINTMPPLGSELPKT